MPLSRRSFVHLAAAVATPSVASAALPDATWTASAHARLAAGERATQRVLSASTRATVAAIADAVIPRSETPGALDIGAPDFIELLLAEWVSDEDRSSFTEGVAELEARAMQLHNKAWPALDVAMATSEVAWAEARADQPTAGQRTLRRIKSWTVHAWITSEAVQKTVIRTNITPGKYEGCVPRTPIGGAR